MQMLQISADKKLLEHNQPVKIQAVKTVIRAFVMEKEGDGRRRRAHASSYKGCLLDNATPEQQTTAEQPPDYIHDIHVTMATVQKASIIPMEDLLFQVLIFCLNFISFTTLHSIKVKSWKSLPRKTLSDLLNAIERYKPARVTAETSNNVNKRLLVMLACTLALLSYRNLDMLQHPVKWIASLGAGDTSKVTNTVLKPNEA